MTESITAYADQRASLKIGGFTLGLLRRAFLSRVGSLQNMHLRVNEDGQETLQLGDSSLPCFSIDIHDPAFYVYACLGG
ncbi:MAG: hypothetical protein ACPHER_07165, partial [Nevskiales bacterium]